MKLSLAAGACALCAALVGTGSETAAQTYPSRPVRLIVPYPPGGSNDIVGRLVGQNLSHKLGQNVVIDNRPGAGSTLGIAIASQAEPDGYTLVIISVAYAFGPALYKKLPYDAKTAFLPVSRIGNGPNVFTVHPSVPVKTIPELVALAKAKPGTLNFASAGVGSGQHLWFEFFKMLTGVNIVHIPFKGGAPAMIDVIAGNSHLTIGTVVQMLPLIRSGKLRALATGGTRRSGILPELPTLDEAGVKGYEGVNWWGILVPAKTSPAIVDRLDKDLAAVLAAEELKKQFITMGAEVDYASKDALRRYIDVETEKWSKVAKQAGIQAQ